MSITLTIATSSRSESTSPDAPLKITELLISHFSIIQFDPRTLETKLLTKGVTDNLTDAQLSVGLISMFKQEPELVTWNGREFILPLLEFKMLEHMIPQFYLIDSHSQSRKWANYHSRYSRLHLDLCDLMAQHGAIPKMSLMEVSAALKLPAVKPYDVTDSPEIQKQNCIRNNFNTFLIYLKRLYIEEQLSLEQYKRAIHNLGALHDEGL